MRATWVDINEWIVFTADQAVNGVDLDQKSDTLMLLERHR